MKNLSIALVLFFGFSVDLAAQQLKSGASLRAVDNKEKTILLTEKETKVFTLPSAQKNWYDVHLKVYINTSALDQDAMLVASGTEFFLENGDKLGQADADINVLEYTQATGRKNKNRYVAVIQAKAFQTQFERGSIPERRLEEMLNATKKGMISREMDAIVQDMNLKFVDAGDFTFYPIFQDNMDLRKESSFKILIVYKRGGAFFGIITNGFELDIPVKSEKEESDLFFYFPVQKATDRDFQELMNYVFDFIRL